MFWPLQILFHFIIAPNFYSSRTIYSLVSWSIPLANSSRLLTRPSSSFLNHYHELKTRKFEHLIYKYNLIDQINQTVHNKKEMWDYVCRAHLLRQDTSGLFFPCFFFPSFDSALTTLCLEFTSKLNVLSFSLNLIWSIFWGLRFKRYVI